MNSNKYMTLSGNFKPKTGVTEEYTIKFDKALTSNKIFNVQVGKAGKIYLSEGAGLNYVDIPVASKKGTFTFKILWIDEQPKTLLTVFDKSGEFGTVDEVVTVTSSQCILTKDDLEVKQGDSFIIKSKLPLLATFSAWDVVVDWDYGNGSLLEKNGSSWFDKSTQTISLPLKAIKIGKAVVSVVVNVVNPKDRTVIEKLYKGSLEFDINNPYSISMDNANEFACEGTKVTYRLNGLGINPNVKETILWVYNSYGKLISEQGRNAADFEMIKSGGFFTVSAKVKADNEIYSVNSNNRVWIGKPTLNLNVNTEHSLNVGDEIILKLTEFDHYSGNIEYNIESGNGDLIDIERMSGNEFKIKSNHPKILNDKLGLKFIASNVCGSVTNTHIIKIEADQGSSFENPIELKLDQNHLINYIEEYNLREYGGDIQNFKLYFTFTLMRRVHFSRGIHTLSSINSSIIQLFDNEKNRLINLESSDSLFRIGELQIGKYYLVIDLQNDIIKEDILKLFIGGGVAGGDHPTNPYIIDVSGDEFEFSDSRNTNGYYKEFKYIDENGEEVIYDKINRGNEIFYSIKLKSVTQLLIDTVTDSTVNTEFHIMQGSPYGWKVLYHDDGRDTSYDGNNLEEWGGYVRWKKILGPGEYTFVFNGAKWGNAGQINGIISLRILGRKIKGISFDNPYELGYFPEHRFKVEQMFCDIIDHTKYAVEKLYYHFSTEKNLNFSIRILAGKSYLPVKLYNANREEIIPSIDDPYYFEDLLKGDYYCVVSLVGCNTDSFNLNLSAWRRGLSALNNCSYNMGVYNSDFAFEDDINTADGDFYDVFRYKDANGNYPYISVGTNHFYYKITLLCDMELSMDANWSFTEFHLLQGEPYEWQVLYHRMAVNDPSNTTPTVLKLDKGEYKLVFNRVKLSNAGVNNGTISLAITGRMYK